MAAAHHSQKYYQALVLRGEVAWLKQSPSARRKQAPLFKPSRRNANRSGTPPMLNLRRQRSCCTIPAWQQDLTHAGDLTKYLASLHAWGAHGSGKQPMDRPPQTRGCLLGALGASQGAPCL